MATSFEGKTIVITGASEGIGRALALALAGQRARLALAARNADRLAELARQIEAEDHRHRDRCRDRKARDPTNPGGHACLLLGAFFEAFSCVDATPDTIDDVARRRAASVATILEHTAHEVVALPGLVQRFVRRGLVQNPSQLELVRLTVHGRRKRLSQFFRHLLNPLLSS